jgi:selenide,water dikinase
MTTFEDAVSQDDRLILADAQTSGGLVIAVAPENEALLLEQLEANGVDVRETIGEIVDGPAGHIQVTAG